MVTITISDEKLQQSFDKAMEALLAPGQYHNPVKDTLDQLLGYNGDKEVKEEMQRQIREYITKAMATEEFAKNLGLAMAAEIAKREVDKLQRKL